jgi:hypothetical protein
MTGYGSMEFRFRLWITNFGMWLVHVVFFLWARMTPVGILALWLLIKRARGLTEGGVLDFVCAGTSVFVNYILYFCLCFTWQEHRMAGSGRGLDVAVMPPLSFIIFIVITTHPSRFDSDTRRKTSVGPTGFAPQKAAADPAHGRVYAKPRIANLGPRIRWNVVIMNLFRGSRTVGSTGNHDKATRNGQGRRRGVAPGNEHFLSLRPNVRSRVPLVVGVNVTTALVLTQLTAQEIVPLRTSLITSRDVTHVIGRKRHVLHRLPCPGQAVIEIIQPTVAVVHILGQSGTFGTTGKKECVTGRDILHRPTGPTNGQRRQRLPLLTTARRNRVVIFKTIGNVRTRMTADKTVVMAMQKTQTTATKSFIRCECRSTSYGARQTQAAMINKNTYPPHM